MICFCRDITSKKDYEQFEIFEIDSEHFGASYEAFLSAIHPDDRIVVDEAWKSSLVDKKPYNIEHRLLMDDGRVKWVYEQCRTEFSEEGHLIHSQGKIVILNPVAENLTGWSHKDAYGKPLEKVLNIIHEYTRKPCQNPAKKVFESGKIVEMENHTILIAKDGK